MVRIDSADAITWLTIDRPERRNAVDLATLIGLQDALAALERDGTRVVVLTGTPPAFSAGADLGGVESGEFAAALAAVLHRLTALPLIVLAAIDGPALGAGAQLAAACDLRIATPTSTFGIPAAKLGLAVDQWTVRRVAEQFTPSIARAMLLGAETFSGTQLAAAGAVHRLGDRDDAAAWAAELAALAPLTVQAHKLALEANRHEPPDDSAAEAARATAWASADAAEGRAAFAAKRRPRFTGR